VSRSGSCQCGAVTVATTAEPFHRRQCWCKDCQKLAAGGPTHNAFFKAEEVAFAGPVKSHDVLAASGNHLERAFCGECGTPLYAQSHVRRHLITVRIGLFDEPESLRPQSIIWTESAPSWAHLDPDLPHTERQPPPAA
jgi:hypothetical protein